MRRVVNPESYRQLHQLGDEDPVPPVDFGLGAEREEIQQELDSEEPCFISATAQFFLQEITLEEYFDRLIGHLQTDAVRHTFDNTRSTKLDELLGVDLIAGTVKSLMLNRAFLPLQETAPSRKPTFDRLDAWIISRRFNPPGEWFEHSTQGADPRLCEIRHWLTLLPSEGRWVHFPMTRDEYGLYYGLPRLLAFHKEPELRTHADVGKLCRVFSGLGIILGSQTLSRFLSIKIYETSHDLPRGIKPCSLAQATMTLECFPVSEVAAAESKNGKGKKLRPGSSATLLLPITQWPKSNRDRLAVMRMLLEQGCDPNGKISNNVWEHGFAIQLRRKEFDTPLHQAAERGDEPMVKLLLEFSARGDIKSGSRGDTPAQRATTYNRARIAAKLDGK